MLSSYVKFEIKLSSLFSDEMVGFKLLLEFRSSKNSSKIEKFI